MRLHMTSKNSTPGIALNEDSSHYYTTRSGQKLDKETVASWVDQYADTQVLELFLNPNGMQTNYDSKVWDPIWKGYDPEGSDDQPILQGVPEAGRVSDREWIHTTWQLHNDGIDPYELWIDRCRQKKIAPWISMRMNDVHCANYPDSYIHSDFWKSHPEYRRVPYRFERWTDHALDYGQAEVRKYHMALIKELLERYDMDGLELDWMRFGFHFRPGHEADGAALLTEFMTEVRTLANAQAVRRGHPIKIGVRVPTRPQTARGLGMDAVDWVRRDLIDMIVLTPFWDTIEFDMPIELWTELMGEARNNIVLAAGLELNIRPYPMAECLCPGGIVNTAQTVFGAAASLINRGVDRIYLFNYMDSETTVKDPADYRKIIQMAGDLKTIYREIRRHIVTYADTWAPGEAQAYLLPETCSKDKTAMFRFHIGPKPTTGVSHVVIGLGEQGDINIQTLAVRVNGELCTMDHNPMICQPIHPVAKAIGGFSIPSETLHDGYNLVEVTGNLKQSQEIVWMEISIVPRV